MAKNVNSIAKKLGATVKGEVPDTGGGAFGMARLAEILTARLQPGQGLRPGRPSDPNWVVQGKVPMTEENEGTTHRVGGKAEWRRPPSQPDASCGATS